MWPRWQTSVAPWGKGQVCKFSSTHLNLANSNPEGIDSYSNNQEQKLLLDLSAAQLALAKAIEDYQPYTSNSETFRKLANGVFQAEGCVTAWFNGGDKTLYVSPAVNIGQTYSPEALAFFVQLYHELGKIGKLSVSLNVSNKVFIRWHLTNWNLILTIVSKYFSYVYGEKLRAFKKLEEIYILKSNLANDNDKVLLIKLVYSLTTSGKSRKLSISEKLKNLSLVDLSPELDISYPENSELPGFLFLLGFLLGDGSIYIKIRTGRSGAANFIPMIIFFQKDDSNSTLIFGLLSKYLKSIGISSYTVAPNKAGGSLLRIEGIMAVGLLIPYFREYSGLGYWKSNNINMLLEFFRYHTVGAHTYPKGLNAIFDLLYKDPNNRDRTLYEWKEIMKNYFHYLDSKYKSGFQFITPITKGKKHSGWIVVFSEKLVTVDGQKLINKNKSFFFSTYGDSVTDSKALKAAIQYRDSVLDLHLKELIN